MRMMEPRLFQRPVTRMSGRRGIVRVGFLAALAVAISACGSSATAPTASAPAATAPSATATATTAGATSKESRASGAAARHARAAALRAAGGGKVRKVERGDEGVAYSIEVTKPGGRTIQVLLDKRLRPLKSVSDAHETAGGSSEEGGG